jgi:hypothetical protein
MPPLEVGEKILKKQEISRGGNNHFVINPSVRRSGLARCDGSSLVLPNIVLTPQHPSSEDRKVLKFLERISEVQRNLGD